MAKPKVPDTLSLSVQFIAGDNIDTATGKLSGVLVAEIGTATGHFAFLDRDGKVLGNGGADDAGNFPLVAKRVPLAVDQATLQSIVEAGKKAGRVRTREDHKDTIEARVGFMENFRIEGTRALGDCNVLDAYKNRALLMETAQKTPELIGMSGDFKFSAEVIGDLAFMRVGRIDAVDLVDEGAVTHSGLFRALPTQPVDNKTDGKSKTPIMAKNKDSVASTDMPDLEDFGAKCEEITTMANKLAEGHAAHAEHMAAIHGHLAAMHKALAAISPVNTPTPDGAPAPVHGKPGNPDASVKDPEANFAALTAKIDELSTKLAAIKTDTASQVKAEVVEMQKQFAALGIKPTVTPKPAADVTTTTDKADEPKDFMSLKASIAKDGKITGSAATRAAMAARPDLWEAHLIKQGIAKPAAA